MNLKRHVQSPVSMQDSDFSPEALTEILTEILGQTANADGMSKMGQSER